LINGDATAQLPPCCPTALQWEVHKFGGASLADASLYRTVGDLLLAESASRGQGDVPTMAIVSAKSGMTDLLVKVVDSALVDFQNAKQAINAAVESQIEVLQELAPPDITDPIAQSFRNDAKDILSVVQSLRMLHTVPSVSSWRLVWCTVLVVVIKRVKLCFTKFS
jgi:aspartokinase/homoserine dehydrogenase 1